MTKKKETAKAKKKELPVFKTMKELVKYAEKEPVDTHEVYLAMERIVGK